ncbi:hypothetical protein K503DRAFT_765585 [Rhizopogon vinicolor AM-OR11-026]|uniref:Peptidase M20 domain-containing protein 2 n=1 Tax=Rhizopogon vinicolor AM-OR11-026 TaxID=1314800 RepID=A0A1B7NFQ4_9AGAM|nr:hypothetical protein K503DRAFT_765585 [Rhizopogon vinicolor AM-OR11-026]
MSDTDWRPEDDPKIRPPLHEGEVYRPDILNIIETSIDGLNIELRALSLDIHDHPELMFEEKYAHDAYTAFMEKRGFTVTRNHHLETAWVATYTHGQGGRVLGVNSEMDALPGIGHACGHNFIGISGVAVALAAKAAMENLNIDGKVILLGTPAEEGGLGKVLLYENGVYDEMDVCLMCHPGPGPRHSIDLNSSLAISHITVDAHTGLNPWEGQNALDAAVLAYNNVSLLRQQIKPTHRVQGVFEGKYWNPEVRMEDTSKRVIACFEGAAIASGCKVKVTVGSTCNEIRQNKALGDELADVFLKRYGAMDDDRDTMMGASTDFVIMPGLHPSFSIPTVLGGGNHTPGFIEAARSEVSHDACLVVSKALAAVGVLADETFLWNVFRVKDTFEEDKKQRG